MRPTAESFTLTLKVPWRIAHGASTTRQTAVVRLGEALGEGALPPYWPWRFEEVAAYVAALDADALAAEALDDALGALPPGPPPARAALDLALHDRWARGLGQPLYRLLGLNPDRAPATSYSFGIAETPEALAAQIRAAPPHPIYKIKLGTGSIERDEALVRAARDATDARLGVDANGAWSVDEAVRILPRLGAYGLDFVEQPLPADAGEAWHTLHRRRSIEAPPIFADESIQTAADVVALHPALDGVNLKLSKCGGLRAVRRLIELARALGLGVMLGCMIESSLAVTAAAHLAPLADFADLDAPLFLADDSFDGLTITDDGRLRLPERPGLGVVERGGAH